MPTVGPRQPRRRVYDVNDLGVNQLPGKVTGLVRVLDEPPHDLDVFLRHRLLRQPGGFEGAGAMAEEVNPAHLSISDRAELKGVGFDRDATLPTSAAKADGNQDPIIRRLDELKRLHSQVDPLASKLVQEPNDLRCRPSVRRRNRQSRSVDHRAPVNLFELRVFPAGVQEFPGLEVSCVEVVREQFEDQDPRVLGDASLTRDVVVKRHATNAERHLAKVPDDNRRARPCQRLARVLAVDQRTRPLVHLLDPNDVAFRIEEDGPTATHGELDQYVEPTGAALEEDKLAAVLERLGLRLRRLARSDSREQRSDRCQRHRQLSYARTGTRPSYVAAHPPTSDERVPASSVRLIKTLLPWRDGAASGHEVCALLPNYYRYSDTGASCDRAECSSILLFWRYGPISEYYGQAQRAVQPGGRALQVQPWRALGAAVNGQTFFLIRRQSVAECGPLRSGCAPAESAR